MRSSRTRSLLVSAFVLAPCRTRVVLPGPDPDRRLDQLCGHPRDQHGAAVPHRRPGTGAAREQLQGRAGRRLSQHAPAHGRPAPDHPHRRTATTSSRATTTASSTRPTRHAALLIGSMWLHIRERRRNPRRGCTTPWVAARVVRRGGRSFLLFGGERRRRRRDRGRRHGSDSWRARSSAAGDERRPPIRSAR